MLSASGGGAVGNVSVESFDYWGMDPMGLGVLSWRRHVRRVSIAAAAAVAVTAGSLVFSGGPASAATTLPDGLSQETAAASCWEIKQNDPASQDGVYWLVTPALQAPQQFYCDQTTNGGGWVLIGRGREGWKQGYNGVGTPEALRDTPSSTAAFAPAQLPAKTVDGLLNGGRVDALGDGIRLRRARDMAGTSWQEVRFSLAQRDRWVWTFGAQHAVKTYSMTDSRGTTSGSGGTTYQFGTDGGYNMVGFREDDGAAWRFRASWSYGGGVSGSLDASSYLWGPDGQGWARPFTQVFLRPRLTLADLDFGTIAPSGTPAQTQSSIPDSNALRTVWGVSGLANGNTSELNTEVSRFAEVGGKVFVGGNFRYVQQSEAGAGQVEQPYLAAFTVGGAEWVSTFRPVLNGQVKAIAGLPDGRVAIGGQFTTVNGVAQAGIAFLDATTGQLSGPQVVAQHRTPGSVPYVRDFDVQDGFLYVAGSFTHLAAAGSSTSASAWNGGRIALATSLPDTSWNANLNGASISVDASDRGDRTYFAGYFKMKGASTATSAAALQTAAGAALVTPAWTPTFSAARVDASGNLIGNLWQNAVNEVGDRVWLGGSQHALFSYDRDTFELRSGNITLVGGDFQTVEHDSDSSLLVAGCHCGDYVYEDAFTYTNPERQATQIDKMNLIGAWNAGTGRYEYEFSPNLQARAGFGAWASFFDSTGVLWAGGDFSRSTRAGGALQWSGGFVRFAPRDSTAPAAPGAISATPSDGGSSSTLAWGAVTGSGPVTYEILRDNRVIASTTSTTYTVPNATEDTTYFVRARDAAGNRSASTAGFVLGAAAAAAVTFIADGATWAWRSSSDALPDGWNTIDFDDSGWNTGRASFGRGVPSAATDIDPDRLATKPLSAQFRNSFQVDDPGTVVGGKISVVANDGVVLYLNGTELTRVRMPAGDLTQNTVATGATSNTAAIANRIVFDVPQGLVVAGTNVLAASVHANYRATPDLSFELSYTARRGEVPGAVTGLAGTATESAATLTWTAPAGNVAPVSYAVDRAGERVGTVSAPTTTFTDSGLAASTAYEYTVTAIGADGSPSAPASTTVTTASAAATPEQAAPAADADAAGAGITVPSGSTWAWRYSSDPLPGDWAATGFDDSSWSSGSAVLARGVAGTPTNIDPDNLATKPLSAQFRHEFAVDDTAGLQSGTVTVTADDGVAVYLNGTELGRSNLPTGSLTQNSYATAAPRASNAAGAQVTFTVPVELLHAGTNVLAATVHANYRATPDLSFDLALTVPRG